MVKAKDPKGPWSEPVLVKAGKGIIDTCPFWDEDGKVYMVHAYAGSRAGLKSVITICELNAEATKAITPSLIISFIRPAVCRQAGRSYYVLKTSTVLTNGKQYLRKVTLLSTVLTKVHG